MKPGKIIVHIGLGVLFLAHSAAAEKPFYAATFKWNPSPRSGKTLQFTILKNHHHGFSDSRWIAKIDEVSRDGQRVEAICSILSLETYSHGKALLISSVDMSCKSTGLGALSSPATVYFPDANAKSTARNTAILRFGTWLQGYQQAALTTQIDQSARFNAGVAGSTRLDTELIREFNPEKPRPGAAPVKLARAR